MLSRSRVGAVVDDRRFQIAIIVVIAINAVTLGLETSESVVDATGPLLPWADRIALTIFVVELLAKIYAHGWRFFREAWNVFDLVVVAIALVPASGPFAVVRALRVLRILRLVSAIPSMRRVVNGLLGALPGMASIGMLLALVIYVAAVIATSLFGDLLPEYFGHLGTSLFTLFQIMTGEAWPDIARELMQQAPLSWIFFVVYILISSFAVLNLFIAVVVNAMEGQIAEDLRQEEEQRESEEIERDRIILAELRALRAEVAQLRAAAALDDEPPRIMEP